MQNSSAVHAAGLSKSFGARVAVNGVDLALAAGDCLALFGPNGAGKSTLLKLVAGLLKPTAGEIRIAGVNVRGDPAGRSAVGLVSHQTMLYPPLTALENVEFSARLFGVASPQDAARAALRALDVETLADSRVARLSRGQQQRVSIARAIVHSPAVLLLDEPYSGLDEAGAGALTGLLQALRSRGSTLVLVTHNIAEGLALASQAAILSAGRLVRLDQKPAAGFDAARFAADYRALVGASHAA